MSRFMIMLAAGLLAGGGAANAATLLVEAEGFENHGGWVLDQQFMDLMGSPYLLAHGLGVPVADATTTVTAPAAGTYHVFVRTRDWVAPWKAPGAPGRFQLLVAGKPLAATFGTEGADWHWQPGGTVQLPAGKVALALHDLTGFEGRCDAIVFSSDPGFAPPEEAKALAAFRRKALGLPDKPAEAGTFDLVVIGGGIAGTCASLSAARLGLSVALVQDRPVIGGNNSSEIRVWLGGNTNFPPYPRIGDVVRELDPHTPDCPAPAADYGDDRKMAVVKGEKGISLFLNWHANQVEKEGRRIKAVVAVDTVTGKEMRFAGRWFADCTGDATIGFLAGADNEMHLDGHMGPTNLWRVVDAKEPSPFPRCPWAVDLADKPFPSKLHELGRWYWENGFYRDPIVEAEHIRDTNLRAMYGAWDAVKNAMGLYPNHKLEWAAYVAGKRESRRLLGDVVLTKDDLLSSRAFPDGCFPTSWAIDLHLPDKRYEKGFESDAFISTAHYTQYKRPYWVPYRCLYSRNVPNLFMAGRDISVTHEALGTVRVQRTTGMMGEVVGMAASLCKKHDVDPRGVYEAHLDELKALMQKGVGKAPLPRPGAARVTLKPVDAAWGKDLARDAKVTSSGDRDATAYPLSRVNDGIVDVGDNDQRWLSEAKVPHWVELAWEKPQSIRAARVVSGFLSDGGVGDPIEDFVLQYRDGAEWKEIPGAGAAGNTEVDWRKEFAPVTTRRIRLWVTKAKMDLSRIWEIGLYGEERRSLP